MNYRASLQRLFKSGSSPKLGLERMHKLLRLLGEPQQRYRILHVAGTNGKGSTCAFLDSMLGEARIRRGRYTSPHLQCARERISLNGSMISEAEFCELEEEVFRACQSLGDIATFFERMTAMALLAFARNKVEVAVLEVGLGGRLDATNVVTPVACGITRIDMDHAHVLGSTLAAIGIEKAGIIKAKIPVISDTQEPEVKRVIEERVGYLDAPFCEIGGVIEIRKKGQGICIFKDQRVILPESKFALHGVHQTHNAAVAAAMIDAAGLIPDLELRRLGIQKAMWPGRYETVNEDPLVILDGAHNPAGMRSLVQTIRQDSRLLGLPFVLITGMTSGHDHRDMAKIWHEMPCTPSAVFATKAQAPRALSAHEVAEIFTAERFPSVTMFPEAMSAIASAMDFARSRNAYVLVAGSLYLVGDIRSFFCAMPRDDEMPLY